MTARLKAVPSRRERGLGIIRVSMLGQRDAGEIESPDIQREAILRHCAERGIEIVQWLEAIDESGSQARSKWWAKLDGAIDQVRAGEIDVIVAWKFSRVARDRYKRERAFHLVKEAGGRIDSAAMEGDDVTAVGKLTRGMVGQFDAFYSDMISEGWHETHSRRVARGIPHAGSLPWGWVWRDGSVERDPERAPYVAPAYQRYLDGHSAAGIARWLNSRGMTPPHSAQWTGEKIRPWLDNPIHTGMITYRGKLLEGAHEGLVDRETWERYRSMRAAEPRRDDRTYLATRLARCPTCAAADRSGWMGGFTRTFRTGRNAGKMDVAYCCRYARKASAEERQQHGPWSMGAGIIEGAILTWLRGVATDVDNEAMLVEVGADTTPEDAARLRHQINGIDEKIADLYEQLHAEVIPKPAYDKLRDRHMARRGDLEQALQELERVSIVVPEDPSGVARKLLEKWEVLAVVRRRAVLTSLIREVLVHYDRREAEVVPVWRRPE